MVGAVGDVCEVTRVVCLGEVECPRVVAASGGPDAVGAFSASAVLSSAFHVEDREELSDDSPSSPYKCELEDRFGRAIRVEVPASELMLARSATERGAQT